jgi:thiamine-phosphate pyrophosphorylase
VNLPRLYAILDADLAATRALDPMAVLDAWLDAGVRLVQVRAKRLPGGAFLRLADRVVDRAHRLGALAIVNDRADVARLSGADGVHVGQDDLAPADARRLLLPGALVGISTHDETQIREALAQPVDYLAIGPVFATGSKERPDPLVGLAGVRAAATLAAGRGIAVVAIGGITADRASEVIAAGAASVAVISDLIGDDPGARARKFLEALRPAARDVGG